MGLRREIWRVRLSFVRANDPVPIASAGCLRLKCPREFDRIAPSHLERARVDFHGLLQGLDLGLRQASVSLSMAIMQACAERNGLSSANRFMRELFRNASPHQVSTTQNKNSFLTVAAMG